MKFEWTTRVSKLTHAILDERRLVKGVTLPIPEDLAKLDKHLKNEILYNTI